MLHSCVSCCAFLFQAIFEDAVKQLKDENSSHIQKVVMRELVDEELYTLIVLYFLFYTFWNFIYYVCLSLVYLTGDTG